MLASPLSGIFQKHVLGVAMGSGPEIICRHSSLFHCVRLELAQIQWYGYKKMSRLACAT